MVGSEWVKSYAGNEGKNEGRLGREQGNTFCPLFHPGLLSFFSPPQFFICAPPSECLELATSYPTSTSKDFISIAKTLLYMHIKVQQTRSYPNLVISGQHTCRAMGSNVKSQESPTESSRASSIAFNWEAYSSKNCPYFLNCASPTISINV